MLCLRNMLQQICSPEHSLGGVRLDASACWASGSQGGNCTSSITQND